MVSKSAPDHQESSSCTCAGELALLRNDVAELRNEVARLALRLEYPEHPPPRSDSRKRAVAVAQTAALNEPEEIEETPNDLVGIYRSLFAGRDDVFARQWERDGRGGWAPAYERAPGQSWLEAKEAKRYLPLTDAVVRDHLEGRTSIGLYPMLPDDSCRLLTCDFDGSDWQLDAQSYAQAARAVGLPTATEISRSGQGAHVWMFFSEPVPALDARALGFALLREAMAMRGEIGLESYDRFFPTQDYLPSKGEGLGNLIALPLHGRSRSIGVTIFVDPDTFTPHRDQWRFLAGLGKITPAEVHRLCSELGLVAVGPDAGFFRSTLRQESAPPRIVSADLAGMLAIRRAGLPPSLLASLKHASSLANPEFHKNENLRLSNWNTPRFIRCYLEDLEFLHLPRAMVERAGQLVADAGSKLEIVDRRADPEPIAVRFTGVLREPQARALTVLSGHELAVLEAPPGSGKTVIGCALIAHHQKPTLVLVDRAPLMQQWRERLGAMLDVDPKVIGQIGGGKSKPTGIIDLAMMQTVARMDDAPRRLAGYGLVIVDEAHHAGAPTVEKAVRRIPARRWIGLTATAYRRDGLGPVIFMHCGPKRHVIPMIDKADPHPMTRSVHFHQTDFELPDEVDTTKPGAITGVVFKGLVDNESRNELVCNHVDEALARGRNCLVLTRQTRHVEALADLLSTRDRHAHTLYATKKPKELKELLAMLAEPAVEGLPPLLVIATDRYVGEGYDCPRLDTLFLAHPVSFKGSMVQYVGRILRVHPGKTSVEVHDYVDARVGVLNAMWRKRARSYSLLGFTISG